MQGNTSDRTTRRGFLKKIEESYGKAPRVGVMDGGVPRAAILKEMREPERRTFYGLARPKGRSTPRRRSGWVCRGRRCGRRSRSSGTRRRANSTCGPKAKVDRVKRHVLVPRARSVR